MGIEAIRSRALQALRPPADLPLAEWIERNIFLPQTASALPGKMKLWAYQRGICDALDDRRIGAAVHQRVPGALADLHTADQHDRSGEERDPGIQPAEAKML